MSVLPATSLTCRMWQCNVASGADLGDGGQDYYASTTDTRLSRKFTFKSRAVVFLVALDELCTCVMDCRTCAAGSPSCGVLFSLPLDLTLESLHRPSLSLADS